jgi:hypothetical protein
VSSVPQINVGSNPLLSAALDYAALGYGVFPCRAGTKKPATQHGYKDATTNAAEIRGWWTSIVEANIGLPTNGLIVVDIDGFDNPWTGGPGLEGCPIAITPRGGRHLLFKQPAGRQWRNTESELAPKVDTRADGGYIVVAPSVVGGRSYRWDRGLYRRDELPQPPPWLIEQLDALVKTGTGVPKANGLASQQSSGLSRYVQTALDAELGKVALAVAGQRNGTLNAAAFALGQFVGAGTLDRAYAEERLVEAAQRCGLDVREAASTIRSGLVAGMAQPRQVPGGGISHRQQSETPRSPRQSTQTSADPTPVLITLADVPASEITWLWPQWIPRGALTILDGDPGLGKSTVTLDLAARITNGWKMPPAWGPCEGVKSESVLLLNAEDDSGNTIRPRLEAAGADLHRIQLFERVTSNSTSRPPIVPFDLERIRETIKAFGVALIIIDPFLAYLDSGIDAHKDQDVRHCLHILKEIAAKTGAAILLVRHLNKLGHNTAIYRGGGSIGITGAARSALIIGRDPNDPQIRVLCSTKSNLGPAPRAITYHLESIGSVARVAWGAESDLTANDILSHPSTQEKQTAGDRAAIAIVELLANGPLESTTLDDALASQGYSQRAIKEGRKKAQVHAFRESFSGKWKVRRPGFEQGTGEAR